MRTREKAFTDYGFQAGEEIQLKDWCKSIDFSEEFLLLESAKKANENIHNDIYFSIVKGLGYDRLDKKVYQTYTRNDFYGYQRKTLALFLEALIQCGRYPFMAC